MLAHGQIRSDLNWFGKEFQGQPGAKIAILRYCEVTSTLAIFLHKLAATGVARNALAIAEHMRGLGWRVVLITVRPGGQLAELADGIEHVVLGGFSLPRKLELLGAAAMLRREIDALSPDVILSAGNHAHLAMLVAMNGNTSVATVYRMSNDLTHGARATDLLTTFNPRRLITQRIVRDATRLVLVSPHLAEDPLFSSSLRIGKAEVVANGVDVAMVRRRAHERCDHPWASETIPIVLAVGRLDRQKNLSTLVEAFALARSVRKLRLMIVGSDKPRARKKLQKQASRLGVLEDIAFVGQVANPFPFFRAAAVLALPSKWEGCSNVLLEALACGLPVLASKTAGNARAILEEGRFGVLVNPLDATEMSRGLLTQLDPGTRVLPGERAAQYDRAGALAKYQRLFEDMTGSMASLRTPQTRQYLSAVVEMPFVS